MTFKNALIFQKILPTNKTFESGLKVWMKKLKSVPDEGFPMIAINTLDVMSEDF